MYMSWKDEFGSNLCGVQYPWLRLASEVTLACASPRYRVGIENKDGARPLP